MVNVSVIVITLLVGWTIFLLSYSLFRLYFLRQTQKSEVGRNVPIEERLLPFLRLMVVPQEISHRWGTPEAASRLVFAGLPWNVEEYVALRWIWFWLVALLALGAGFLRSWDLFGQFLVLLLIMVGWFGPGFWLRWRVERRQTEIDIALPNFLDRLTLGLEAGLSFDRALQRISFTFSGLLGADLRRMVRQVGRGHSRSDALDELANRSPSQDLRAFVAAVKQSDRLGTSLAKALRVQTELLRAKRRRRAEEASQRLPILIVFPLVFFFLPALLIVYLAPPMLHLFLGR